MTAQKHARLLDVCLALDRKPKVRREGETRDWRFPGNWIRRLSLGRVGSGSGRPHNLVERPQINNILFYHRTVLVSYRQYDHVGLVFDLLYSTLAFHV